MAEQNPTPSTSTGLAFYEDSLWLKIGLFLIEIFPDGKLLRAEKVHLGSAKITRWICHPEGAYSTLYNTERSKYLTKV